MKTLLKLSIVFASLFPALSFASYPIPEYEMVVIESLPADINLDMKLSDILKAKEASQLAVSKQHVYEVLIQHLSPLLSNPDFMDGYNLLELASQIPAKKILEELLSEGERAGRSTDQTSDFLVLILPKQADSQLTDANYPYFSIYSKNKAPVIDQKKTGFGKNYEDSINERVSKAIQFAYKRNYIELENNEAFFVGALVHFHIAGSNSQFKIQMAGGLPTNMDFPFEQIEKEAIFTKIRTPQVPKFKPLSEDYPGAIVDVTYGTQLETPSQLKIKFGNIGRIENSQWVLVDEPDSFEEQALGWGDGFGVSSIMKRFNVPNLFGDLLDASGYGVVDSSLSYLYNIQLNIHEVEIDIQKLEITDMRVTIELPFKETNWFTEILEPGMRLPTFEIPSITEKVIDGGNNFIEPYREEIQFYIDNGDKLLTNIEFRNKLWELISKMLDNKSGGQP